MTDADKLADLRLRCAQDDEDISQTLGAALGYPRYADDPSAFPGAVAADGVCVGDHVAASLAAEAAERIAGLEAEVARLRAELAAHHAREEWFESRDVEVRRADEDDGIDDDIDDDIDDGDAVIDEPVYHKWGVVVWVAGRGLTYYGETLARAIEAARGAEAGTKGGTTP